MKTDTLNLRWEFTMIILDWDRTLSSIVVLISYPGQLLQHVWKTENGQKNLIHASVSKIIP